MPRGVNDYDAASLQGRNVARANTLNVVSPGIITSGILAHLDAGNRLSYPGSGTTWLDLSGNGYNQTLNGGVSAGSDHLVFNGSSGYTQGSSGLATGTGVAFSLELWVNFSVITGTRWWLAVIGQYGTGALHCIGTSATATQFGVWGGLQNTPNLQGINQWLHVVTTYDKANLTTYVNGYASGSSVSTTGFNFSNSTLSIGLRLGTEAYFNGKISVVRVYNRALTPDEVLVNFNATRARFNI